MMMKKRLLMMAALLMGVLLLCGCQRVEEQDLPELRMGVEYYRPYVYLDENGQIAGIDVEIAQEACRRMGYTPVFTEIDWKERDQVLNDGRVDCLWSCFAMDDQEQKYTWVGPYMRNRQIVVVTADSDIQTLSELEGKRVAVKVGSTAERLFLKQETKGIPVPKTVYSLTDTGEVVVALCNGYVDACVGTSAALREAFRKVDTPYRILDEEMTRAEIGVAFSKDNQTGLPEKLRETLLEMRYDGTMKHILEGFGLDTAKALGGIEL